MMLRVRTVLNGWPGGPGLNTFYFGIPLTTSAALAAPDAVGRVRAFWFAIAALFPTSFTAIVQPNVDDLDYTNGQLIGTYPGGSPANVSGSNGTLYNAYATALLLRENTGAVVNGRRAVGRSFIGPVTGTVDAGGAPNPVNLATLVSAAQGMLTGTTTTVPTVWHRPNGAVPGNNFPVTNFTAAPYFAVLRSRRD